MSRRKFSNPDLMTIEEFTLLKYNQIELIKFLQSYFLLPNGPICCNLTMQLKPRSGVVDKFAFRCRLCKKFQSIRIGSYFENSKLSLHQCLMLIVFYCEKLTNQNFLCKILKISSYSTIVDWKSFIRDVFIDWVLENSEKIGAPGMVVQVDETLFCKRKYGVGRILQNQDLWVVGGIDEAGKVFMEVTYRRNRTVLKDILVRNICQDSIVVTDGWGGYNGIEDEFLHEVVIHADQFVNSRGYHTNRIESTWGACKRLFRNNTNKQREMIFGYLCEYVFRKNFKGNMIANTFASISQKYPLL